MLNRLSLLICSLFVVLANTACETEVQPNADQRPIIAVYGVLNPDADVNFIRIAKGYLTEGDAIAFAGNTDLSIRGAKVYFTFGSSIRPDTLRLTGTDTVKPQGTFLDTYHVYGTTARLQKGQTYTLHVEVEDEPELNVTAQTTIPFEVDVFLPRDSVLQVGVQFNWDVSPWDAEPRVAFVRSANRSANSSQTGVAFEIRAFLRAGIFNAVGDTTWLPLLRYGPEGPITQNSGCNDGRLGQDICYRVSSAGMIGSFQRQLAPHAGRRLVYDDSRKNSSAWFEITAMNQALFDYIRVNNPGFQDFTSALPEYTNLVPRNSGTIAVGVLGAISVMRQYVNLSECTRYNLGLNEQQEPVTNCVLFNTEQ
jgi:hypothetical protein